MRDGINVRRGNQWGVIGALAIAEENESCAQSGGIGFRRRVGLEQNIKSLLRSENARHAGNNPLAIHVERRTSYARGASHRVPANLLSLPTLTSALSTHARGIRNDLAREHDAAELQLIRPLRIETYILLEGADVAAGIIAHQKFQAIISRPQHDAALIDE